MPLFTGVTGVGVATDEAPVDFRVEAVDGEDGFDIDFDMPNHVVRKCLKTKTKNRQRD